ncbi:MAG: YebC/PmpR family DNA-binding transcriptional regulator [Actinobacteria bacterium]|nr:YebC/PmpR family DNA-binding transcriptional regulator [Actinomycetota bacterium]MDI6831912.1 YebC/PmpR family DNA-binding transcriptional regulator [Actinomycetota bacterium]
MSGHSKWSTIKHKKGAQDAKRGQLFSKLSRAIIVAAREGGGNPEMNIALANAIEKAKSYSMPKENIERAIKRGTGEGSADSFEKIVYEGYGANGVAIMVDVMTDNRNRAAADIRRIFSRTGGSLGTSGSVAWMFEKKGNIIVNKDTGIDEDLLLETALEAGAEDMVTEDDHWEIVTDAESFRGVLEALKEKGFEPASAEVTMLPKNTVKLDKEAAKKVLRLVDALEEYEDVQEVYANFDIPDEILEELSEE